MKRPARAHPRGQASVMIALMIVTFLSLFTFVVNTGLLIHAKINLQNAADLAAYSGAGVQARILNNIAFLNYEMRRNYKKFLFRYYVVGNMFQAGFPGGAGSRIWSPDGDPANDFRVPAVCINFNSSANDCQIFQINAISPPTANPLDAISQALRQQIQAFEDIRYDNCKGITELNQNTLIYWLFNTDPQLDSLEAQYQQAGNDLRRRILNLTRSLSTGMGLIPRNFILFQRIKTLESYLNYLPSTTQLTLGDVQSLPQRGEPVASERAQAAFYSAYHTLGEYLFTDIALKELVPRGGAGANVANIQAIKAKFDAYYVALEAAPGATGTAARSCVAQPRAIRVSEFPVGVYKDPSVLTYYPIQLTATARILFSPFGATDLRLSAYSAAQPFGSRIGPVANPDQEFVIRGRQTSLFNECSISNPCYGIPNLKMTENDQIEQGWTQGELLRSMYSQLSNVNQVLSGPTATANRQIGFNELQRGYAAAMAPNPYEKGLYNVPNDAGASLGDPSHQTSGDLFYNFFDNSRGTHAVWAPVFSAGSQGDELFELVRNQLIDSLGSGQQNLAQTLAQSLTQYLNQIKTRSGDDDYETFNIVQIKDPLNFRRGNVNEPIALSAPYLLNDSLALRSSYNPTTNPLGFSRGRLGYSVKFVPFSQLLSNGKLPTNGGGGTLWANDMNGLDPEQRRDTQLLKH